MKITILCIIVFFLGFGAMGYMHEQVHIAIYNNYDIESHIEYFSHFPDLVTISEEGCPTEMCNSLHAINEVIGYPFMVAYAVLGVFLITIIMLLEDIYDIKIKESNKG